MAAGGIEGHTRAAEMIYEKFEWNQNIIQLYIVSKM